MTWAFEQVNNISFDILSRPGSMGDLSSVAKGRSTIGGPAMTTRLLNKIFSHVSSPNLHILS